MFLRSSTHGKGACVAKGWHAWQMGGGAMCGKGGGVVWQRECMVKGCVQLGLCVAGGMPGGGGHGYQGVCMAGGSCMAVGCVLRTLRILMECILVVKTVSHALDRKF